MSYVSEVSNALAARGNALAQGELQRGQVYGNLAQNLGQIPGQAFAFDQQRQAALQNNELKKIALESAQRKASREKEYIRIANSGLPQDQMIAELERVAMESPEDFLSLQAHKAKLAALQQQVQHQKAQEESQTFNDQLKFQAAGQGGQGVPLAPPTPTGSDLSGNALSPIVPQAQPNIPEPRVNPSLTTKFGVIPGRPTAEQQDVQKRQTAAEELAGKKELIKYTAEQKPPGRDYLTSQVVPDRKSPTGWRYRQWNPDTNAFDRPGNPAPPPASTVSAANPPTVTIVTRNERGEDVTKVLTKAEALKLSHGENAGIVRATPAMTRNRITAAQNSMKMGEELIKALDDPNVQAGLGPVMGRATGFQGLVGNMPPELAELKGLLKSWSELQPAVHGMRSSEMAEEIEKSAPTHWTPEALKGFVRGFQRTAKTVSESELPAGATAGGAPIGAGGWTAEDEAKYQSLEKAAAEKKTKLGAKK